MTMSFPSPTRVQSPSPRAAVTTGKLLGSALAMFEANVRDADSSQSTRRNYITNSPKSGGAAAHSIAAFGPMTTLRPPPLQQQQQQPTHSSSYPPGSSSSSSSSSASSSEIVAAHLLQQPKRTRPAPTMTMRRKSTTSAAVGGSADTVAANYSTSSQPQESADKVKRRKKVVTRVVRRTKPKEDGDAMMHGTLHRATTELDAPKRRPGQHDQQRNEQSGETTIIGEAPRRLVRREQHEEGGSAIAKRGKSQPRSQLVPKHRQDQRSQNPVHQRVSIGNGLAPADSKYRRSKSQPRVAPGSSKITSHTKPSRALPESQPKHTKSTMRIDGSGSTMKPQHDHLRPGNGSEMRKVKSARQTGGAIESALPRTAVKRGLQRPTTGTETRMTKSARQLNVPTTATLLAAEETSRQLTSDIAAIEAELASLKEAKTPLATATTAPPVQTMSPANDRLGRFDRKAPARTRSSSEPHELRNPLTLHSPEKRHIKQSPVKHGRRRVVGRVPRRASTPAAHSVAIPSTEGRPPPIMRHTGRVPRRKTMATSAPSSTGVILTGTSTLQVDVLEPARNRILLGQSQVESLVYPSSAPARPTGKAKVTPSMFVGLGSALETAEEDADGILTSRPIRSSTIESSDRHVQSFTNQGVSVDIPPSDIHMRRRVGRVPRPSVLKETEAQHHADDYSPSSQGRGLASEPLDREIATSQQLKACKVPTTVVSPSRQSASEPTISLVVTEKRLPKRVFGVNDLTTPVNPDGKRILASSIIASRLAGLALDDSPRLETNTLSLQERIRLFQTASGVKHELLQSPQTARIGRPIISLAQKRKKGATRIQAIVRGVLLRNALRRKKALVLLQSFSRMVGPRQAYRLRLLHRLYADALRQQKQDRIVINDLKARSAESVQAEQKGDLERLFSSGEKQNEEELLRNLFQENSNLQHSNTKLEEMRTTLLSMNQVNDMTRSAQMQSLRTLQDAVGVLSDKNDALTKKAQKYEEKIDGRAAELNEMHARIAYESALRKLTEKALASLVELVERRCDNEALVKRIVAISADEDYVSDLDSQEDELSMASDALLREVTPKKITSNDGFELSFRVTGLDDDDVSDLCSSEQMLLDIAEEGEYDVEYDEITVEDSLEADAQDETLDSDDDASSVWDGNHDIMI